MKEHCLGFSETMADRPIAIKPIAQRRVQSPTWKNTVPPKESIPTWNDIT